MISTDTQRVQIKDIIDSQFPAYVREDFPLLVEFVKTYYLSQEAPGSSGELIQNIDKYLKLDSVTDFRESTILVADVDGVTDTISVDFNPLEDLIGTYQFPDAYGLIQIDDEIILYEGKTANSFTGCKRGFSGTTSFTNINAEDRLTFATSSARSHSAGATVKNLSALLLVEFLKKIKNQFTPGFGERALDSDVNKKLFISRAKDFYSAKGTDDAFKALFGALYGESVEVIKPKEFLFRPSDAQYRVTKDIVVEAYEGNPSELINQTLFQDAYPAYGIEKAYASINDVEKLRYNQRDFYRLSVDFDYSKDITFDGSVLGDFSVHPKTQVVSNVALGASVIDVDSTIGFPDSGELAIVYENGIGIVTYRSKSTTQFFDVGAATTSTIGATDTISSGTDAILRVEAYGYVGLGTENKVSMRIGSVLSEPIITGDTFYYAKEDTAKIKALGITTSGARVDDWKYNIAPKYQVEEVSLSDASVPSYKIDTFNDTIFDIGDAIHVIFSDGTKKEATITDVLNESSFIIAGQGTLDVSAKYHVERLILKPEINSTLSKYSYLSNYTADIQNTYVKFDQDFIVASSSLPRYYNTPLNFYDKQINLSGSFSGETFTVAKEHGLQTGDAVFYKKNTTTNELGEDISSTGFVSGFDINEGVYFISKVNSTQFKLSTSQANLYSNNFVSVSGIVTSNTLTFNDFYNKDIQHQHLLREIKKPSTECGTYETESGKTGILVNGVEILNYKGEEKVFYGEIEDITVSSKGENYDVINPPIVNITDDVGAGATAKCSVAGELKGIDIIDGGFDYVTTPKINITGGNGLGAVAEVSTKSVVHSESFNSTPAGGEVILETNIIGFGTHHKFRNLERVLYKTDGQDKIAGLSTDAQYYVETLNATQIKLYESEGDAISGINTVNITGYGVGVQRIEAINRKKVISNIGIIEPGSGYENKERTASTVGIITSLNQVNIKNHGYQSGEIVRYTSSGNAISGVTDGSSYYVTSIDDDNFLLSSVGVGTTTKSYYYDTKQYVNFDDSGSGIHSFNYEPIIVTVDGEIGVTTFTGQSLVATIQPKFRGSIESVYVTDGGVGYGASTIIGYDRQPVFALDSGSGAELLPIINNGSIQEVLILSSGSGYNSAPELEVYGTGKHAKLTPVLENGQITNVIVNSAGTGYEDKTRIGIIASGLGAKFRAELQNWTVNLVEKEFDNISDDDGVLCNSTNEDYGIQYAHLYAPRKLRESVYGKSQDNQIKYGVFDLKKVNTEEVDSTFHSPIIGWAYDGNPIYGPYGFTVPEGGAVRAMRSGYKKVTKANRPDAFKLGFFAEDYEFAGTGDLDEHNGRFCVTPDYPNGTYAYFATINPDGIESSGTFAKYRKPVFPYLIGNTYKCKPNAFNFDYSSNQVDYDLNETEYFRNTTPYAMLDATSSYEYLYQPNTIKESTVSIKNVSTGYLANIGITTGGDGYQVGDAIQFEKLANIRPAKAKVSKVNGKRVTDVSVATTSVSSFEIAPLNANGSYVAFSNVPHNLTNLDIVSLSGFNTSINSLQKTFSVGVSTATLSLSGSIGTSGVTGRVAYFNVYGKINDDITSIRENDIYQIDDEKVKVLNVDRLNSRLRVLRSVEGTVSAAHTATSILYEVSRKFTVLSKPEKDVTFNLNKEIYFNPAEQVALGSEAGVGIGTTLSFATAGAGITQIFVPTRSIYVPGHELNTGDVVTYKNNGGTSITVSTASSTFQIADETPVYVAKVSNDLIGISTVTVGLGSTGTFTGTATTTSDSQLLYLTGIGTGTYHSFTTVKPNVVQGSGVKNVVTVATAATHGLIAGDIVDMAVRSGVTDTITVKYDDYNRRIVFNPKSFVAGDVNVDENSITIANHGYSNGDKVIHTASSPSGGLETSKIYYIFRYTENKVKLCTSRFQALQFTPEVVDITSADAGTLSVVNPALNAYRGGTVKFDMGDSSLSSINNSVRYSAFELNFYTDRQFKNKFVSSGTDDNFEVSKTTGKVGIDSTAATSIVIRENVPEKLFYKFTPVNVDSIDDTKKSIAIDTEVPSNNEINVNESIYQGTVTVTGIGTTSTFTYSVGETPENTSYVSTNSNLSYKTDSSTAYGGIGDIKITYKGDNYENVIGVSTVVGVSTNSIRGGAILEPSSENIGRILDVELEGIGFDYPTDNTLRPTLNLPEVLQVEPLASFREIGISSAGRNYSLAPSLVVIDGFTQKQIKDVDIRYSLGDTKVRILNNTSGMYNTPPRIVPTSNSNGVTIKTMTFDDTTKEVTVGFNTSFSTTAPFAVGDKVLIENTSVGVGTTGLGYNSANYDYTLFTLDKVFIPVGGSIGIVTFSLSGLVPEGQYPGNFDTNNSAGIMVAEKDFPIFDVKLKKNDFIKGERVKNGTKSGTVSSWNNQIDVVKITTASEFYKGERIVGETSRTQGIIKSKHDFKAEVKTNSSSIVKKGWSRDTGILNLNTERISDNHYYQNFSYSLKSQIPMDEWDDVVSSMNHTSGFLKFSDLVIESNDDAYQGVFSDFDGSNVTIIADAIREIDLSCYPTFDLVTENSLSGAGRPLSDKIYFGSRILTDYFESFGNRVLTIDDISTQFNNTPRSTKFSNIKTFSLDQRFKRFLTYVEDKRFTQQRQTMLVNVLQNGTVATISQYGRTESSYDLGSFDFTISGTDGNLLFYPTKFAVNNFNISYLSFDIDNTVAGIGSTSLGDVAIINSASVDSISSATDIVSIATTYRSSKVLIEVNSDDGILEHDELNVIHDGTDVEVLEYGQLITNSQPYGGTGLGTYSASISGGNVNIRFTPVAGIACTVNSIAISIASTESTGIGNTIHIGDGEENDIAHVGSYSVSIASSTSPGITTIATSVNQLHGVYNIISIEDTTNNRFEMIETISTHDSSNVYLTEYGNVRTNVGLGTIGAEVVNGEEHLHFTPLPNIATEVKVFQAAVHLIDADDDSYGELDLNNASLSAGYAFYEGTGTDVKRAFTLRHKEREIFKRDFDGSSSSVVDVSDNSIIMDEHFFVTGEELVYSYGDLETPVAGLTTTKFYAVKIDDRKIKLATSAENALNTTPVVVDITGVGVGTDHTLTAKNQNTKCMILIDNYIQSPVVDSPITTGLAATSFRSSDVLTFVGVTSFFGGDLIKIDDEIMKINTVGFGTTNAVLVDRPWMGTGIATHAVGATVTKIEGNYNIVDNTLHFIAAPQGPTPIGRATNPPNERDWTGITTFSTFQGRSFLRSAAVNSSNETYTSNYVFDDISQGFDATTKSFTLKSEGSNAVGFSTNNGVILINGILQGATGQLAVPQDYNLEEGSGITTITFTGTATSVAYDPNNANIPVGGMIAEVGSTGGFGYQPLVAAGGTAIVSSAGTVTSVSIGNSGSGYRPGAQTVNVGVTTGGTGLDSVVNVGTAEISGGHIVSIAITNGGSGYQIGSEPTVVIDAPLSYSNIPLIYSSSSASGLGTAATVDIVVGQGSSVIDFELRNLGYKYGQEEVLTVGIGSTLGIPTDPNASFSEMQITVKRINSDKFSGWHFGELEVLDKIETQFDGSKKSFTIARNEVPVTIRSAPGSSIDVASTILVFINDILQVPGEAYTFTGGSTLTFTEAPKGPSLPGQGTYTGDTCKVLFYKGSGDIDVVFRDILETVKDGDTLKIEGQETRLVDEILSSDTVGTNPYNGAGIDGNPDNSRAVTWCKQKSDKFVNGKIVSKARILNAALVNPTTHIIQPVGVGSTVLFVDSVKTFFDPDNENVTTDKVQTIAIVSQDVIVGASATATVSAGGTISAITISDGGRGYTSAPEVTISNPVGFGSTMRATASATLTGDAVTSISVSTGGTNYTSAPQVLIEVPTLIKETNESVSYQGDFGEIVGVKTTSVGIASTGYVFDFFIPIDSYMRNSTVAGAAVTISGIATGYYFTISGSNVGSGVTSLYQDNSVLGIGTQFLDGVFEVATVSVATTAVAGVGVTYVARVTTSVSDYGNITGIGLTEFYGDYSWGRIQLSNRTNAQAFNSYTLNGATGINTSAVVTRVSPLKLRGYSA